MSREILSEIDQPELVPVVGGWFACGLGWCVRGDTIEEALSEYHAAVRRHAELAARPDPVVDGSRP